MKKLIMLAMVIGLLVSGCGLMNSRFLDYTPSCNTVSVANVGSAMVEATESCKNDVYGNVLASATAQLIYSGKTGSTIKITYREFYNNIARPAFSQDLTYDLAESKIITFRNSKIEVKEATNSSITFIILDSPACRKGPSGTKIGGC